MANLGEQNLTFFQADITTAVPGRAGQPFGGRSPS